MSYNCRVALTNSKKEIKRKVSLALSPNNWYRKGKKENTGKLEVPLGTYYYLKFVKVHCFDPFYEIGILFYFGED